MKKLLIFIFMIVFLTGCTNKKDETNNQIKQVNNELESLKSKYKNVKELNRSLNTKVADLNKSLWKSNRLLEEKEKINKGTSLELKEKQEDIKMLNNKLDSYDEFIMNSREYSFDENHFEVDGISLNMSKEEVIQILGEEYVEFNWEDKHSISLKGEGFDYDEWGVIGFYKNQVTEIRFYSEKSTTNFDFAIGDNYYITNLFLSKNIDGYISIHSIGPNPQPNYGWYQLNDEILILNHQKGIINMIMIKREDMLVD